MPPVVTYYRGQRHALLALILKHVVHNYMTRLETEHWDKSFRHGTHLADGTQGQVKHL